jgi:hypothetical protein
MARTRDIALTIPLSSAEGAHKLIGLAAGRELVVIAKWWFRGAATDGDTCPRCKSGGELLRVLDAMERAEALVPKARNCSDGCT